MRAVKLCVTVADVAEIDVKAVVPPTAPVKVVVPVPPVIVRAEAPFSIDEKLMFAPEALLLMVDNVIGVDVKFTAPVMPMAPEDVKILPLMLIVVAE